MTLHLNKVECALPYCLLPILAEIRSGILEKKPMMLIFNYIFPLKSGMVHHLNKNEFPSPKDGLCQVCLILVKQFWTRGFSKIDNGFLLWYFLYTWSNYRVWFFICINSNSLMIQWSQTYKGHKNTSLLFYILHTIFFKFYIFFYTIYTLFCKLRTFSFLQKKCKICKTAINWVDFCKLVNERP